MSISKDDDPVLYAVIEELGFRINAFSVDRGSVVWGLDDRSARPATTVEIALWNFYMAKFRAEAAGADG